MVMRNIADAACETGVSHTWVTSTTRLLLCVMTADVAGTLGEARLVAAACLAFDDDDDLPVCMSAACSTHMSTTTWRTHRGLHPAGADHECMCYTDRNCGHDNVSCWVSSTSARPQLLAVKTRLQCTWRQYRLEESVSHRRSGQVTQLFTYLLTTRCLGHVCGGGMA